MLAGPTTRTVVVSPPRPTPRRRCARRRACWSRVTPGPRVARPEPTIAGPRYGGAKHVDKERRLLPV
eukprot:scaffold849_cov386-Prasinococcus_capsulatus_cf.AAC.15